MGKASEVDRSGAPMFFNFGAFHGNLAKNNQVKTMKKLFLVLLVFFGATALTRMFSFSYEPLFNMGSFVITIGALIVLGCSFLAFKAIKN